MALKINYQTHPNIFLSKFKTQSILHVYQALIDAYVCERAQPQWRQIICLIVFQLAKFQRVEISLKSSILARNSNKKIKLH